MAENHINMSDEKDRTAVLEVIASSSAILHFAGRHLSAVIGRNGIQKYKREGDGGTPSGLLPLRRVLYRADRVNAPTTSLLCEAIKENDGWCDDSTHTDYNRQILLPHSARHERLWLDDHAYDIVGILGYNDAPTEADRGSAIFLHVSTSDMKPTAGCIALHLEDLRWVLEQNLEAIFVVEL